MTHSPTGSSGYHAPDPPMPVGGYRRAVPRDVLTGAPLRPDTIKRRVRRQHDDRPEPLREHGYGHDGHVRYHTPRVEQRAMLPNLDDLLDDADDDANDAEDDVEVDDA